MKPQIQSSPCSRTGVLTSLFGKSQACSILPRMFGEAKWLPEQPFLLKTRGSPRVAWLQSSSLTDGRVVHEVTWKVLACESPRYPPWRSALLFAPCLNFRGGLKWDCGRGTGGIRKFCGWFQSEREDRRLSRWSSGHHPVTLCEF